MCRKLILGLFLFIFILACDQGRAKPEASPVEVGESGEGSGLVLATVGGEAISEKDIEDKVARQLRQVRMDLYQARKEGADQVINEKLLDQEAKKRGTSTEELLKTEIRDKIKVSDKEVKDFYEQRKKRFEGKTLEEVKGLITNFVQQQEFLEGRNEFLSQLRKKANVKFHIDPPRVEVATGDHPGIGPEKAPVKVIEFSDYQCPFCARSRPTINQIVDTYGKKVYYVFRDFPLSFHKDAFKAHEAAHCANDQKKYWEYNRSLFNSQRELKIDDLKKYARELKLKMTPFNECLDSGKYKKKVQDSLQYGQSVGVSGTPAFFVNGRMISGARPFAAFQEVIDDELSRFD